MRLVVEGRERSKLMILEEGAESPTGSVEMCVPKGSHSTCASRTVVVTIQAAAPNVAVGINTSNEHVARLLPRDEARGEKEKPKGVRLSLLVLYSLTGGAAPAARAVAASFSFPAGCCLHGAPPRLLGPMAS